jgi:hypothetical protein
MILTSLLLILSPGCTTGSGRLYAELTARCSRETVPCRLNLGEVVTEPWEHVAFLPAYSDTGPTEKELGLPILNKPDNEEWIVFVAEGHALRTMRYRHEEDKPRNRTVFVADQDPPVPVVYSRTQALFEVVPGSTGENLGLYHLPSRVP